MNAIVNRYIYLFQLVGVYIISGNPEHVVLGENVAVTLTCVTDDDNRFVAWSKDTIQITNIRDECVFIGTPDNTYNYACDPDNNTYNLIIPPNAIIDGIQNVEWGCRPVVGTGSKKWQLTLSGTYGL